MAHWRLVPQKKKTWSILRPPPPPPSYASKSVTLWNLPKRQCSLGNWGTIGRKAPLLSLLRAWILEAKLPLLSHDDGVRLEIAHIDGFPLLQDFRVWCKHQPADVREKESTASIMWIRVSLAILMVHPVVQRPLIHVALPTQFRTLSSILLARLLPTACCPCSFSLPNATMLAATICFSLVPSAALRTYAAFLRPRLGLVRLPNVLNAPPT